MLLPSRFRFRLDGRRPLTRLSIALLLLFGCALAAAAVRTNGFDLTGSLVPAAEIHPGGPVRDGIPSIDRPRFVGPTAADFLRGGDEVLGLQVGNEARAYPIRILNWHEIVNDEIGGQQVAVTFCPLCGTGVAFVAEDRRGRPLTFGVSGLLYNSDVLLYDRQSESLWSQIMKQAISGPRRGERLRARPLTHTTWHAWRRAHPETLVLSTETGFRRDYSQLPYAGYETEHGLYFPVSARSNRYHPKERVLGLRVDTEYKAYPFAELSRTTGEVRDRIGGEEILVRYDRAANSASAFSADGRHQLPAMTAFWFAWYAFHPETGVFVAPR
ncbi:MAG: DUF3179 domain-containing protein [Chromatiaceae bacterium]|nr:MAG: DUF3179 domain-containing protein [Chromatiaceae bacterium]